MNKKYTYHDKLSFLEYALYQIKQHVCMFMYMYLCMYVICP